jgi:hypothetical protein
VRLPGPVRRVLDRTVGDDQPPAVGHDAARERHGADLSATVDRPPGAPPPHVGPHPDVDNPVLTRADVTDVDHVRFVADPFVVREDGVYHAFFEVKSAARAGTFGLRTRGDQFDIARATSPDGRAWTYASVVLPATQAEHTYPFVFRHDDEWYMSPCPAGETPASFRLYRADPFPDEWRLVAETLVGEVRTDPTPFRWDDTWFLPYQATDGYEVKLRTASSLLADEWAEHPASPLFDPGGNDVSLGGRPVVHDGGVDLFFRRGSPGIVEHWRVTAAAPDRWRMRELATSPVVAGAGGDGWNGRNVHHVEFGPYVTGGDFVVVDGQDVGGTYRIGVYAPN